MRFHRRPLRLAAVGVTATAAILALACAKERSSPQYSMDTASRAEKPAMGYGAAGGASIPTVAPSPSSESRMSEGATTGFAVATEQVVPRSPSPPTTPATQQTTQSTPGNMLIRTGNASVQVDSLDAAIARVRQIAARVGGIVADVSMQTGENQVPSATIQLRIPSERFDEAVSGLAPLGKVESVNVSVQDVGEEYVDVAARVENARRLEQRLVQLLANRTGKLSDVLTVERELARVREEIERYEGRMRYLRTRAAISTLAVTVHEPPPLVADRPGTSPIGEAFRQAWRNFVSVVAAIIASSGVLVPLGVIVGVLILVGRRYLHGTKSAGAASA